MECKKNNFLNELLSLQQDGREAISAPTNWTKKPLLEVSTEVDEIIKELGKNIIKGSNENSIARWHFFIGSPGNGKSAAMGKLCRFLIEYKGCRILDEKNNCLINDLQAEDVPYALDVYEGNNKFASVRIVQDASVVPNPFAPDVDPARELISTLKYAWNKGISLIICTNRGVLEKAYGDNHIKRDVNKTSWFSILKEIIKNEQSINEKENIKRQFEEKRTVFKTVNITYNYLDGRSLLVGRDIFARLLKIATKQDSWEICRNCLLIDMCPFKANRDWLADDVASRNFLSILQRVEAFSGQVIVFREALALVSLFLSGCPRDYNESHPCEWVKEKVDKNDFFSLAMRRIYMSLFASSSPYGFETSDFLRKKQVEALKKLRAAIRNEEIKKIMDNVLDSFHPSTDVGVKRLLGEEGFLSQIDPWRESLTTEFYEKWDGDFSAIQKNDCHLLTKIEVKCLQFWEILEEVIESESDYTVFESHWALRRWSSNFLLHLGALFEGMTSWSNELDRFLELIEIVLRAPSKLGMEDKKKILELNDNLRDLLNTRVENDEDSGKVQLSENVFLSGEWVKNNLKPSTILKKKSGSLALAIQFGDNKKKGGEQATLGAPMFIWLCRRVNSNLDQHCFPPEILTGAVDARIRAASKGKYAFEKGDVELTIDTGKNEIFKLLRIDDEVEVTT
jgi:hypothetical protein